MRLQRGGGLGAPQLLGTRPPSSPPGARAHGHMGERGGGARSSARSLVGGASSFRSRPGPRPPPPAPSSPLGVLGSGFPHPSPQGGGGDDGDSGGGGTPGSPVRVEEAALGRRRRRPLRRWLTGFLEPPRGRVGAEPPEPAPCDADGPRTALPLAVVGVSPEGGGREECLDCELKVSGCQVEQFPALFPSDTRSIEVLLTQEAPRETKREGLGQNQTVATLQCLGSGSKVTVNLQDSKKRPKARYTLKSLSVITAPLRDKLTEPSCYSSTVPKLWFQAGLYLTVQVFLPSISNCKFYPVVQASLEELSTTTIITTTTENGEKKNPILDTDEDLLLRKKWSIVVKALIAITLLMSVIAITVFVIFEVPCPCACPGAGNLCHCQKWRRRKEDGISGEPQPEATGSPVTGKPEKVGPKRTEAPNSSSPNKPFEIIVIHQTYF
ncbi:uncharacterized protein C17orf78 homolog [Petaurus breviceps papuanus]|uniref:uncharacterized protein C17orf78 homolog n=1 Tax=Petaurus breviceps papuanus TaxID=3040969 RepID=UPI0036DEDBB6